MKNDIKGALRSKTIWFGFAMMLGTWLSNNTDLLVGLVPEQYSDLCGYAIGIAIWVLRYLTTQPLEEKAKPKKKKQTAEDALNKELHAEDDYMKDF